jgi:hypothetical protein
MCSESKSLASYVYGTHKIMQKSKVVSILVENLENYCNGICKFSKEQETEMS